MPDILAFSAGPGDTGAVESVTAALARTLRLEARTVPLPEGPEVLRAVEQEGVRMAVLPYGDVTDELVTEVIGHASKPLLLVPADRPAAPSGLISRVLVPLDGTAESAETVAGTVELFAASGADIVVLHVFDATTVPRFWDQPVHARKSWDEEFLARFCDQPEARLELRSGTPGEGILDVVAAEHPDVIALGWSQDLSRGRARTVRTTVEQAGTPVLLLAVAGSRDRLPVGAGGRS